MYICNQMYVYCFCTVFIIFYKPSEFVCFGVAMISLRTYFNLYFILSYMVLLIIRLKIFPRMKMRKHIKCLAFLTLECKVACSDGIKALGRLGSSPGRSSFAAVFIHAV